ncbi:uncharacterized protein EI90DRAFT_3015782 [Cantharellus anzutake]|uniref:uncharacterized protein n=1 Tax=Cantharellus anzutake TaxID=1750568 RepID=UPI0019062C77|nr:uncharacterized protein EI90DRAFT_3015782 [Cantharellus anzutake]KAF8332757.1 hypothetical protein EI90DRAFT_3015782 [Cantharellus anzutake]
MALPSASITFLSLSHGRKIVIILSHGHTTDALEGLGSHDELVAARVLMMVALRKSHVASHGSKDMFGDLPSAANREYQSIKPKFTSTYTEPDRHSVWGKDMCATH